MSHFRTIQALGTPVVLHSNLTKFLGSITASVFLSHIMYWSDKTDNALGVYKSCEQITDETGLSKKEQMTARKILRELGLIVETHKRLEHRLYYRFEPQAFDAWFEANLAKCQKVSSPSAKREHSEVPKGNFGENPNGTSLYTKITTENTTKITTESDYAPTHESEQTHFADEKTSPNPSVNKPTGKTSSSAKKSTSSAKQKFDPKTYPLEDTVDYELWCDFVDMRKSIKKPLTKYACKLLVKDFKEWIDEGLSPNKALGESIKNSWQGVFKERAVIDVPKSTFANQNNTWQQNPKPNRQSELEALAGAFGDDFYSRNNQSGQSQFYQVPQIGVTNHE